MSLSDSYIQKYGTEAQLKALQTLGKKADDINTSKLNKSYDASIFVGNYNNFKSSSLSNVFNQKELKQVFNLLDADGDKKISQEEINQLAKLGGSKGSSSKIDKNDLKVLMSNAEEYVNSAKKTNSTEKNKVVKTVGKNGTKIVTTTKPDGTKIVTKYKKNGDKKSTVKTSPNGDKTTTSYEYVNGHLINAKSKKTRVVDGKKTTVQTSETRYNEKGQKTRKVTKDATGNILSSTKYEYAKNGNLQETHTKKANGSHVDTTYDTNTGKKSSCKKTNADGKVTERVDYDSKTGKKSLKVSYEYDKDGNKTSTSQYTYNANGKVGTRAKYDANNQLISKSTYYYNKDGSMIRTDRDPKTGLVTGTTEFQYDKSGRRTSKTDKDAEGNITSVSSTEYYSSDIQKSTNTITYNQDGTSTKKVNNYDKDGNLTSVENIKYDKDGKIISSKTEKVEVKETELKDLPKIDYKALEKLFAGEGKDLVKYAKQFLGIDESNGEYKKFTNGRAEAWCADFVTYVIKNYAKANGLKVKSGFGSASVSTIQSWAQQNGIFKNTNKMSNSEKAEYAKTKLKPGDVIIWTSNGASHTGIVRSVNDDGTFTTIEGNTSDKVGSNKKSIYDASLTGFIPYSSICT